jgi:hypothetical protein
MPSAPALIPALATVLLVGLLLSLAGPTPAAAGWEPPVPGGVARAFDLGRNPFEGGRHRGVDLAAAPGAVVRAPCPGRVVVAGRVGTSGGVVSVLCGPWRVSHLPLARIVVRRGDAVDEGTVLGALAPSRAHRGLHLGVRRDGTRFGYVDPLRFLDRTHVPPVVVAPPRRIRLPGRTPGLGPAPRPALRPAARPAPRLTRRIGVPSALSALPTSRTTDRRDVAPWPVWIGLAVVLGGLGAGSGWLRRRTERSVRGVRRPRPLARPRASE